METHRTKGSLVLGAGVMSMWTATRRWLGNHSAEAILAALFAIPCGYAVGVYFETPKPYKIYVVANIQSDSETLSGTLEPMAAQYRENPLASIGDVPVVVQLELLKDAKQETATQTAKDLVRRSDTLLVIGHLPSQATEASLTTYFGTRPQVPYIATIASDDNLLVQCDQHCYKDGDFTPLLQLSPTNAEQGESAIRFATQKNKRHFLIVSDNEPNNRSYRDNMVQAYSEAIDNYNNEHKTDPADIVAIYKMDFPLAPQQLKAWQPDCVLYAGAFGEARSLWREISGMKLPNIDLTMITSDSVVETRGSDHDLAEFNSPHEVPVRFTYQTDAADYNGHKSVYAQDAFSIATELIQDLNQRGGDLRLRIKSFLHLHDVADARRSLGKIMQQNASLRVWYAGADGEQYVFNGHTRYRGLFHVWQLSPSATAGWEMQDIDNWHLPRTAEKRKLPVLASQ